MRVLIVSLVAILLLVACGGGWVDTLDENAEAIAELRTSVDAHEAWHALERTPDNADLLVMARLQLDYSRMVMGVITGAYTFETAADYIIQFVSVHPALASVWGAVEMGEVSVEQFETMMWVFTWQALVAHLEAPDDN